MVVGRDATEKEEDVCLVHFTLFLNKKRESKFNDRFLYPVFLGTRKNTMNMYTEGISKKS
jgi:hypothetical protein